MTHLVRVAIAKCKTILIVEDEGIREDLKSTLEFDGYLKKPVDIARLLRFVRQYCG